MLIGEYRHSLDAKNRIFVPAKLREELGDQIVVSIDIRQKCLKVYSLQGWEEYLSLYKKASRDVYEEMMRILNGSAAQVSPDAQGRILLPPYLLEHAQIEKMAVVVGCYSYAEIWSESCYDARKRDTDFNALLASVREFGL